MRYELINQCICIRTGSRRPQTILIDRVYMDGPFVTTPRSPFYRYLGENKMSRYRRISFSLLAAFFLHLWRFTYSFFLKKKNLLWYSDRD